MLCIVFSQHDILSDLSKFLIETGNKREIPLLKTPF